eukprot:CAMPEP_0172306676 /NCGR_PEP_ID=MMETSP1058-20130122/7699_1 /TAXON_ID=83371 /ORGANISM="Detonula confervacea, Strain CCMP 353" /LENGTH=1154 /DNA_ID=CAMNT_0013018641 /DNA_START=135 /DNA_END=3599 /DNA_ORIENTATION=-
MKAFQRKQGKSPPGLTTNNSNETESTARSVDVDSTTIFSNSDNMTQQTNNKNQKQTRRERLKLLIRQHSKEGKADNVSSARQRAAKRNEPPPFTASKVMRLNELKEAKLRAEERMEERREERSQFGNCGGSVISASTCGTNLTKGTSGSKWLSELEDEDLSVKRDTLTFLASVLLQIILRLLPLRNNPFILLLLVTLPAISLRSLLNFILIYAFDHIDFGQMELVKNMDYGKRLFVEEVRKHSKMLSMGVVGVSIGLGFGGGMLHSAANWLYGANDAAPIGSWVGEAYTICSFITLRLGVFVLAALALSHVLLPKPEKKKNEAATERGQKKKLSAWSVSFLLATITFSSAASAAGTNPSLETTTRSQNAMQSILVAGSSNADTFLPIHRFPSPGENLTILKNQEVMVDVPGGKGCNQAIVCAKLSLSSPISSNNGNSSDSKQKRVAFLGQFGNDAAATILQNALVSNNVDISLSGKSKHHASGRGYVMIVPDSGEVSAVVSGGSNLLGWKEWGVVNDDVDEDADTDSNNGEAVTNEDNEEEILTDEQIQKMMAPHSLLLLQCEIPALVNLRLARAARKCNIPVILDVGGEDRSMDRELLECCDFLVPNETELKRLAGSYQDTNEEDDHMSNNDGVAPKEMQEIQTNIGPSLHLPTILKSIQTLQKNGANNVLVTLGSRGSILIKTPTTNAAATFVSSHGRKSILYQPPCALPAGRNVVDETGAGDCYRAAFAVALLEHCHNAHDSMENDEVLQRCMKFASAAGALAVTKKGAVPSVPSRREVEELLSAEKAAANNDGLECLMNAAKDARAQAATLEGVPRGGSRNDAAEDDDGKFPFLFGSRINSMKDRLDLVDSPVATPRDYLQRQATIRGLGCVDFNYPQHFGDYWTPQEARKALDDVNLVAGAVCLRYPSKFARGAMIHPDAELRREAIDITKEAAEVARVLGCNEVVVWSAYDGYDYPFQVSYQEKWDQIVQAFQECCDAYPDIKWSLEFKPTDENTRFFTVPSTGAAMLLVKDIDRPNMGLTLDMGHMLMAGENPGQSIAMVGDKLFGIQLNDGYTRLAAEDGMMFGSIHPSIALEAMYQLRQIDFKGHLYFDTFPQRTDPVKEAEYNIRRVKQFWRAVVKMDSDEVERIAREHDAIGALELVDNALGK